MTLEADLEVGLEVDLEVGFSEAWDITRAHPDRS